MQRSAETFQHRKEEVEERRLSKKGRGWDPEPDPPQKMAGLQL
jgi:hypothetical protein